MIRRPPRSTQSRSSAASDVYKRQVQGRDRLGVRQVAGRDDRPRDTSRDGCQVSRRPVKATVRPRRAKWIPAQVLVTRREEGEATVGPGSTGDELVDGPRPALGLDDEPDMEREVGRSGEDRSIAADLLREHLAPLGPEVALDEQRDRPVADPDAGERD